MFQFLSLLTFMSFSLSTFAESPPIVLPKPQLKSPYKVTGVACLKGEHCKLIEKGEYAGYYIKSNIPLDDPRIKNIRGNMFTKAVLNREKGKLNSKIENLKELAESCKGDVCVAKYDSKGCNVCSLNVHPPLMPPCLEGPHGAKACPDPDPRAYDVNYFCTKKGCTGSPEEMAKLYARGGMCVKYGPNPLPQGGSVYDVDGSTDGNTDGSYISGPSYIPSYISGPHIIEDAEVEKAIESSSVQ